MATALKAGADPGRPLAGRNLAMIFQRPSNRTRVSFEVAIRHLGGHPIPLFNSEIQIGERESTADISRILDRYVDGIVARLSSHRDLVTLARSARGPVVNAMTDREHPCQVLADCLTIRELLGHLAGRPGLLRGRRQQRLHLVDLRGHPARDRPAGGRATRLRASPRRAGARRRRWPGAAPRCATPMRPAEGLEDAEIIYTDVWTSMGQEAEQQQRRDDFAHLQVNDALLRLAPPTARVMHCLPAHRGEEITDAVLDGPQSVVFDQAENRLWAQEALLSLIFDAETGDGRDGADGRRQGAGRDGAAVTPA